MHIKFLSHGSGSARGAADYLTGEQNSAGQPRADIQVLRGDPDQVAAVADSLSLVHRYTSGVIAWSPEDRPAQSEIEAVLDEFEATAWSGLEPDQYAWSAVLHREENGGVHVHIFAARCDLETGKSLNIAPPGWQKTFDLVRDYFNIKYNWSKPDTENNARLSQPGHTAYKNADALRKGIEVEPDPKQFVTDFLVQKIENKEIEDRDDIISTLKSAGFEIPRKGKDYITIKDPDTQKKHRLKGEMFKSDFNVQDLELKEYKQAEKAIFENSFDDAGAVYEQLKLKKEERAEYNKSHYPKPKLEARSFENERNTNKYTTHVSTNAKKYRANVEKRSRFVGTKSKQIGKINKRARKTNTRIGNRAGETERLNNGVYKCLQQSRRSFRQFGETAKRARAVYAEYNKAIAKFVNNVKQKKKRRERMIPDEIYFQLEDRIGKLIEKKDNILEKYNYEDQDLFNEIAELERIIEEDDVEAAKDAVAGWHESQEHESQDEDEGFRPR